jgi:hypothetical protein
MDDDLFQLEAELKRLRPAVPSRGLLRNVERELTSEAARRSKAIAPVQWLVTASLAAAATVALMYAINPRRASAPNVAEERAHLSSRTPNPNASSHDAPLKPIAAQNVLLSASDEGLVTLGDGTQARKQRLHYVDTITWKNPRTNASLTWTVPREEIRVVPIAFQ